MNRVAFHNLKLSFIIVITAFLESSPANTNPYIPDTVWHQTGDLIEGELAVLGIDALQVLVTWCQAVHVDMVHTVIGSYPEASILVWSYTMQAALIVGLLHQLGIGQFSVIFHRDHKQTVTPGGNPDPALGIFREVTNLP